MSGYRVPWEQDQGARGALASSGCVAGFEPGPVGAADAAAAEPADTWPGEPTGHRRRAAGQPFSELERRVANAAAFTLKTKARAEQGARLMAIQLLPAGTTLYRIGSTLNKGKRVPPSAQFSSPWWMRRAEFDRILGKGQQDTSWSARVLLAIASAWGSECDLQVSATTTVDLYAWIGKGKAIDVHGTAVPDDDPAAHWVPEPDLLQLYVPGLGEPTSDHHRLFHQVLGQRSLEPWLPIGAQTHLPSGKPFVPAKDGPKVLPPGRR